MPIRTNFRVHVAGPVCQLVSERGGSVEAVLRRASMPPDAHALPYVDVPLPTLHRFHEEAANEIAEPLLGLKVGARLPTTTWDVMHMCCLSARTLGDALARLPALIALFNSWVELTVTQGKKEWTVDHRISGEPLALSRHGNELWMSTLMEQMKRVAGAVSPTQVWFAHPRPRVAKEVAKWFGVAEISWGAGSSGLALRADDVARPLQSSDPVMFQVLEKLTAQVLKTTSPKKGVTAPHFEPIASAYHPKNIAEARTAPHATHLVVRSIVVAIGFLLTVST